MIPTLLVRSVRAKRALTLLVLLALPALLVSDAVFPIKALPAVEGDQGQMAWNLWHVAESVQAGRNPYLTHMVFFPIGANLATHTLAGGFFPVTLVVKGLVRLTGLPDAYYPFIAYKAIVYLCFFLLTALTYRFLRHLGCTRGEAVVPAVAYAFCAFYRLHAAHLNHLAGFFIPWAAWRLMAAARSPSWRNWLLAALVLGSAVYFTEFALFIWMAVTFFLLGMAVSSEGRTQLRAVIAAAGHVKLAAAGALFAVTAAFFAAHFLGSRAAPPAAEETAHFSANLAGFVIPTWHTSRVWASTAARLGDHVTAGMGGYEVFVGYTFLGLGLCGVRRQPLAVRVAFWVAIVFFALSMGPRLKVLGWDTAIPLPYAALGALPGYEQNRTPVRLVSVAMFLWTVPAAMGLRRASTGLAMLLPKVPRAAVLTIVLVAVAVENHGAQGLIMKELRLPLAAMRAIRPGPVLNLPLDDVGIHSGLQILHGQPIATGYLARLSTRQREQIDFLKRSTDGPNDELVVWLTQRRFRTIVADRPIPWVVVKALADRSFDVVHLNGTYPTEVVAMFGATSGVGQMPSDWLPQDRIDAAGRAYQFPATKGLRQIDLLADCDETYVVELSDGRRRVGELALPPVECPGLRWRSGRTPEVVHAQSIDHIRVRPSGGDGLAAVRGVLVLK